jgi:hypothetical protein
MRDGVHLERVVRAGTRCEPSHKPPAQGPQRYQPVSVRVFLERPECGTSAARRLEPVGVDELELVGSGDIHERLAHRRVLSRELLVVAELVVVHESGRIAPERLLRIC